MCMNMLNFCVGNIDWDNKTCFHLLDAAELAASARLCTLSFVSLQLSCVGFSLGLLQKQVNI